jgi:hypothetical protein
MLPASAPPTTPSKEHVVRTEQRTPERLDAAPADVTLAGRVDKRSLTVPRSHSNGSRK